MKFIFLLILVFALAPDVLSQSFGPGSEVDLIYEAEEDPVGNVFAIVYSYSAVKSLPVAHQIEMKKSGNKYLAKYKSSKDDVFLIWKVSGAISDNNNGDLWDFLALQGKKPKKNAYLRKAFSLMGNQDKNFGRNAKPHLALEYLSTELKNHPKNTLAEIAWLSLQLDLRKIDYDKYAKALKKTLNHKYNINDENLTRAVSRALKSINKEEKAKEIEERFARKHPDSELVAEFLISDLSLAKSMEEFNADAKEYFQKFPNHSSYSKVLSAFVSNYARNKKYGELERELLRLENISPSAWLNLANSVKIDSVRARFIDKSLSGQENLINNELEKSKPSYFSLFDWTAEQNRILSSIYLKKAELELSRKKYEAAVEYFEKSHNISNDKSPSPLYLGLAKAYELLEMKQKVLEITSEAVLNSVDGDSILAMNKRFYPKGNYDAYLSDLLVKAVRKRRAELEEGLINGDKFFGMLRTTDGKYFDSEGLLSSPSVIIFWSSWCGPCQAMTPAIEELEELYAEEKDVDIYVIDVWEEAESTGLDDYLDEIKPRFNILIERTGTLPQKYGVLGLPSILYLDKKGRVRQKVDGFKGSDNFVRTSIDLLEILKK